ncbi:hypothetical protein PV416_31560 [Streptomyces ipomoeae]|jgi:DnaJ-class molecular chaperone|uniref:Molecular chaperone DnaJ n=1 Tax=Streptomyces ipomoeae 91-03 TaxID=698759 RepID=L1KL19_9ACTN|nr:hypothetical protein [Streptomyces ipomoeae]EKX61185.1 hypothetical protein STRIP9103_03658 [Streptomyces ipomoeae 91-03]MDX2696870.1 hypothetical protein [Streptomyces ipomoeae]MDX2825492.1 hypothetical protein [Streptomyces ipomoeae]MDX2842936.1 hypothetical protein [Streptomyces ipomoeae]MDX2842945.1 hypothetical protein [Streptomyces ipomoeae]
MAARRTAAKRRVKKCTACDGKGEITETVRVGPRKGRATDHRQTAMCGECWGSGEATD